MSATAILAPRPPASPRISAVSQARRAYAEAIRAGMIDERSTHGGRGIPLDVLARIQARAPRADDWSDGTEYYACPVDGRLTYASITRGRGGEIVHVFSAAGRLLARGVYPVDEDGRPSGDVLWR